MNPDLLTEVFEEKEDPEEDHDDDSEEDEDTDLLNDAVTEGDHETVEKLLSKNPDLIKSSSCRNVLYDAVSNSNLKCVQELVKHGADVNKKFAFMYYDQTVLQLAVHKEAYDIISFLIQNGADVNWGDGAFGTPLHIACTYGHIEAAKILLENKASVNVYDKYGESVIYKAVQHEDYQKVLSFLKLLIEDYGADPSHARVDGVTPLMNVAHFRVRECQFHEEDDVEGLLKVVKYLLKHDTWINRTNKDGHTVLYLCSTDRIKSYSTKTCIPLLKTVCALGADVNKIYDITYGETTVLMEVAYTGDIEAMLILLAHGATLFKGLKKIFERENYTEEQEVLVVAGMYVNKPWKHQFTKYKDFVHTHEIKDSAKKTERFGVDAYNAYKGINDDEDEVEEDDKKEEEGEDQSDDSDDDDDEDDEKVEEKEEGQLPLVKQLCRFRIRCHLMKTNPEKNLFWLAQRVTELPSAMQKYLLYNYTYQKESD